tara:strand:- start:77 stop:451 length:375 start_codon:yes stop_codon:yes gene_type:complete
MNLNDLKADALYALKPNCSFNAKVSSDNVFSFDWLEADDSEKPTDEQITAKAQELLNGLPAKELRRKRTEKLVESDWRSNSDVTMSDEWKTYRQALRDLPANSTPTFNDTTGALENVTWPTEPS